MRKLVYLPLLAALLSVLLCSPKPDQPREKLFVKIGDSVTISKNEFIRRAEYMPRPAYCKLNNYVSKKIILNSLVAEKLFALQEGEDSALLRDSTFQAYLKGRKEQAMRQWMYHMEAAAQVELQQAEIDHHFERAGREYEVEYFSVSDPAVVSEFEETIAADSGAFGRFFQRHTGEAKLPTRAICYETMEHRQVHKALYDQDVRPGQVLEPIKIAADDYLLLRVKRWETQPAVTEPQQQQRLDHVVEKLTDYHAAAIWDARILEVMRGKTLDFDAATFHPLARQFQQVYFRSPEQQRDDFITQLWGKEQSDMQGAALSIADPEFLQQPFLSIDGETWTVADFRQKLMEHPLVFRRMNMRPEEFPEQFKLAVVDLVRDHYLTQEAYKKGYDQVNVVQRNVRQWRDAMLATYHLHKFLAAAGKTGAYARDHEKVIQELINPYVDALQEKYRKNVFLDFPEFEDLALTSVDMFVQQPGLPFKDVAPLFPVLTTDHHIGYVARME